MANRPTPTSAQRSNPTAAARASAPTAPTRAEISTETRHAMIAEAAYLRAERRGFVPGHEVEDWYSAESEIDTLLQVDPRAAAQ